MTKNQWTNIIEFGKKVDGEIYRKTVVMVIYDPFIQEFFYCDRPDYGMCCLVSWWVEEDEGYEDALKREIKEETWFSDYYIIWALWERILTHYYMKKKDEHRVKDIQAYLIYVDSSKKQNNSLEPDEIFSIKSIWYNHLIDLMNWYHNPLWWWLEDHIEILKRAFKVIQTLWQPTPND